jgi:4-carboxymuconolactone decarboxylase
MAIRTIAAMLLVLGSTIVGHAQNRMPPIAPENMTEAQKAAVDEFKAARNATLSGPFVPLLRSPEVLSRARAMGDYLRFKSVLPPRLSEFAILIAARQWTQQYEWDAHYTLAMQAGLRPDIAAAVAEGRRPEKMAEDEDILYTFLMELHRTQSVSDAAYQRMVGRFGEQGVVDAIGIQGYYTLLAMVMNTARTPLPAGRTPPLKPIR